METPQDRLDDNDDSPVYNQAMDVINELKQRISELESEINRLEIENWYYEVSELVQYNWWLEIIEDASEFGKEELINIFKSAAKAAGEVDRCLKSNYQKTLPHGAAASRRTTWR